MYSMQYAIKSNIRESHCNDRIQRINLKSKNHKKYRYIIHTNRGLVSRKMNLLSYFRSIFFYYTHHQYSSLIHQRLPYICAYSYFNVKASGIFLFDVDIRILQRLIRPEKGLKHVKG